MEFHKVVNGRVVALTEADIAQREADEVAFAAGANRRELEAIERASGMTRRERDIAIASLPAGHYWRVKAEAAETAIAALRAQRV